ncbi:alanine racemase [Neoasaia chiangmaiensis NBRC 101099]|uniref:Alanine racemase n=1 Tax=Neoasaia chiangmaiensis TaxID=320497 RepID=A0A1U9KP21_9PROT|nr:alanine racemase [Neoasaia chiangmaiensis]AQS87552.1 alanine racemase [Neoasaia chiangmaiensis]GBR42294.1 alanine racemase [Neoasaia chiangmaiensis NBRC 101099]GEN14099.1 alanine racemase [Neoasaia chiangmaiensis]
MSASRDGAGGWLSIDLGAIGTNYRRLREHVGPATQVGAAVKADAYGLGVSKVAPVLHRAGCRNFFVATVDEALALRTLLGPDATIFQLNGPFAGSEATLADAAITPVLNSPAQIALWRALAKRRTQRLPCALQIDSGMSRFGLNEADILALGNDFAAFDVKLVMSHLACADEPDHRQNTAQLATFRRLRPLLPHAPSSLAASSGIYLGPDFHFDLVRPGVALYGGNPTPDRANPMRGTVTLSIRMIQERRIEPGTAVGYSARFVASRHSRIATLSAGYADGLPRAAGGRAVAVHPERPDVPLPIVGRVSMDCLALDITDLGEMPVPPGTAFELIGPHRPIDAVAAGLDTISYELLTSLGHRYHRDYIESME